MTLTFELEHSRHKYLLVNTYSTEIELDGIGCTHFSLVKGDCLSRRSLRC